MESIIDKKSGSEADVNAQIDETITAFALLQKIWKASNISQKRKIRLLIQM